MQNPEEHTHDEATPATDAGAEAALSAEVAAVDEAPTTADADLRPAPTGEPLNEPVEGGATPSVTLVDEPVYEPAAEEEGASTVFADDQTAQGPADGDDAAESERDVASATEPEPAAIQGDVAETAVAEVDAETPVEPPTAAEREDAAEDEDQEEEPTLPPQEVRAIVEALVFASPQPVTPRQIGQVLGAVSKKEWQTALEELKEHYAADGRGLQLVEVAGGWQITTRPEYNDWVRELLDPKTPTRLTIQALETLAVIAYKQPVTLPEVIALRGVKSGGVVKTLLEKRLIRIVGRKEVVGRPMLYGTTKDFLLYFGLKDLAELPKIEEFAEVLGEEVDVAGLKRAIEAPTPVDVPLAEAEPGPGGESVPQVAEPEVADSSQEGDGPDA